MFDLNNNLTLRAIMIVHNFHNTNIQFVFELFPTAGTVAGESEDEYRTFEIFGDKNDPGSVQVYQAAIGRSAADIKQILLAQWNLYKDEATRDQVPESLWELFSYILDVGLKDG